MSVICSLFYRCCHFFFFVNFVFSSLRLILVFPAVYHFIDIQIVDTCSMARKVANHFFFSKRYVDDSFTSHQAFEFQQKLSIEFTFLSFIFAFLSFIVFLFSCIVLFFPSFFFLFFSFLFRRFLFYVSFWSFKFICG